MYKRIDSQSYLSHAVANQIRNLIREERLKPGDKLPSEMQLTGLFGVSRPTIREAVKSLVSQNVIEIVRGKGTFVSANPGVAQDPLGLDFVADKNLHLSLIEVRLMIEPVAARLAAERADEEDLERIHRYVLEMEEVVHHHGVRMATELQFHRSIADATKNPVLNRIVPVIMDAIVKTYRDAPRTSADHRAALSEHRRIYAAIASRSRDQAEEAMRQHLENSYRRTLRRRAQKVGEARGSGSRARAATPGRG